ncbi:MAG: cation-transporting P-type ATPase [Gammaproteobacteria bacterium]|nr:cation-transporting P-type ATPase [Gammaproteobacteria bacterium]
MQQNKNLDWHASSVEHVFKNLETGKNGLSSEQIRERKKLYGRNRLKPPKKRSLLVQFISQFHNVLIYILLVAAVITVFLDHEVDAIVIAAVVILNSIVGCIQEGKAEKALEAIRNMLSPMASVVRNGKRHTIAAEALVPGDVVLLQSGDKVPADIRLFEIKSLQIQESLLTGESNPVDKITDAVGVTATLGDRSSMAYSSTLVTYGLGKGVVVETGQSTEIGRISEMLSGTKTMVTPLLKQMAVFGRWLTLAIIVMSLITFVIGAFVWGDPIKEMFMAAVGIAVAAIPEGLPAIITITLAIGVTRMARRNAIIRRLPAVETMGSVSVICTDKTGTLTRNELSVQNVVTAANIYQVTGSGYGPKGEIYLGKKSFPLAEHPTLLAAIRAGILCNNAEISHEDGDYQLQGNPTDGALLALGPKAEFSVETEQQNCPRTDLIPFQSEHKFMATLHHDHAGSGYIYVKGAPEKIIAMCSQQEQQDGKNVAIEPDYWNTKLEELAAEGKRVVAVAMRMTNTEHQELNFSDIEDNLILLGLFGIIDPPREEAIAAVAECQNAGIRVKMITGDHAGTARTIAEQVGLHDGGGVLIGLDLDELSEEELAKKVNEVDIYARTSPEHKLRLVKALQANDYVTAMTGDGVNDAPALRQAEIGVAMGQKGTEATKEVADMVLADDNFASIRYAVEEGRTVYDNIKKAILYILPTNGGEALSVMLAILLGHMLPITAVQILWVNMITAVTLALALGFESAESNVMKRKPRAPHEPILSGFLIWRIGFVSVLLVAAIFGLFLFERDSIGHSLIMARTEVVNMLVMGEIVYLLNCRKLFDSALNFKTLFGSRPVLIAIATVVVFQMLFTYVPVMQHFFGTASINIHQWLRIIVIAIIIFLLVEIEKAVIRRFRRVN